MYDDSRTHVKYKAGTTRSFPVKVELHQGSKLSSFLFATIIDCITNEAQREAPWDMLFADDVMLCGEISVGVEGREEKVEMSSRRLWNDSEWTENGMLVRWNTGSSKRSENART